MKKIVIVALFLPILLIAGCQNQSTNSTSQKAVSTTKQSSKSSSHKKASKKKQRAKSTSSVAPSVASQSSSVSATSALSSAESASSQQPVANNNAEVAKQYLAGMGFRIDPVLYNGEAVDQAMNEQKAPENTVHDGVVLVYFNDAATVTYKHIGQIRLSSSNNNTITIATYQIPYTITNGAVTFSNWPSSNNEGIVTYQIAPYNYTGGSEN